jgi:hypothetical protein
LCILWCPIAALLSVTSESEPMHCKRCTDSDVPRAMTGLVARVQLTWACHILAYFSTLKTDVIRSSETSGSLSDSCNRPWRPIGLWDVEDPTLSRQSAHS